MGSGNRTDIGLVYLLEDAMHNEINKFTLGKPNTWKNKCQQLINASARALSPALAGGNNLSIGTGRRYTRLTDVRGNLTTAGQR